MPNSVYFKLDWLCNIVTNQLKTGMTNPLENIGLASSEIVMESDHLFSSPYQPIIKVRVKETGTSSDQITNAIRWHQRNKKLFGRLWREQLFKQIDCAWKPFL